MGLYTLLEQRARSGNPIKVGIIGAGKFGAMFLSQVRLTPGMQVVGIADLDLEKANTLMARRRPSREQQPVGDR